MSVYCIGTIKSGSCTRATADGLIVLVSRVIAEGEVVHSALARRHDPQRSDQRISYRLRCFYVPGDDGRGILGR